MKKILAMCCAIFALAVFSGCGNTPTASSNNQANQQLNQNSSEAAALDLTGKKVLIAYFSKTGTTEKVAQAIQENTGGDLVKIETVTPYPDDYNETTQIAKKEVDNNARPELSTKIANMSDYDVIFIGYPIWWHTAPMAIYTFMESYDLSGKTIIPFCTSGGSDIGESMPAIKQLAPNSTILEGLTAKSSNDVAPWLKRLGINN